MTKYRIPAVIVLGTSFLGTVWYILFCVILEFQKIQYGYVSFWNGIYFAFISLMASTLLTWFVINGVLQDNERRAR